MVDKARYVGGRRHAVGDLSDGMARIRSGAGNEQDFLWIGLHNPTQEEFSLVSEELGLHPLAVEDSLEARQRPKIEFYDDTVFAVVNTLRYIDETSDIETGQITCFVGDGFVVVIRRGDANPLTSVRQVLEEAPELLQLGPMAVFHAAVDSVVDNYQHIESEILIDIEEIEGEVFSHAEAVDSAAVYRLKREVLEFRRAALPLRQAVQQLFGEKTQVRNKELRRLFRDVSDHLGTVNDHLDTYDRLLTDVLAVHLSQMSLQQNTDMRKISAWAAIAVVPTVFASIWGMNFTHMPELAQPWGYPMAVTVMVVSGVLMAGLFRRARWL